MRVLAAILTVVLTAPLLAQEPTPAPEIQRLGRLLVGGWRSIEKHEPGRIAPKGGSGRGSERVDLGPGGMSLISDYRAVDPEGKFAAHTIFWWDTKEKAYRNLECSNRSTGGCHMGLWRWDGNDLVSHEEGIKMAFTDFTPKTYTFYMDASTDGGAMARVMTIKFTKTEAINR